MRISRRKLVMFFVVLLAVFVGSVFVFQGVLAQDFGTGQLSGTDLPNDDIRVIVVRIINVLLGVLGTIFLLLMIYAGWLWMTAGGEAQKVEKAKKIITNAIIGLVIVFMSFAFTKFVFSILNDAANGGPGGPNSCTNGAVSGCNVCVAGSWTYDTTLCTLPGSSFRIRDVSTAHNGTDNSQDVYLCSSIQANTNNRIDSATVPGNVTITKDGSPISTTVSNTSRSIETIPDALFSANTTYVARYAKAISDTGGLTLSACDPTNCTSAGTVFDWQFTTGTSVDTNSPAIISTSPVSSGSRYPNQNVDRDQAIRVSFSENIRASSIDDGTGVPIIGNFVLEVLDGENGSVVSTVNNSDLEVVTRADGFDIYWQPPLLFDAFTWFRVTVDGVTDLCGNPMDAPLTWEFQTNDRSPGIGSNYPEGTNVCPDAGVVTVTFNTSMERDVVSIAISEGSVANPPVMSAAFRASDLAPGPYQTNGTGGVWAVDAASNFTVFTFTPSVPLKTDTQYFVHIGTDRVINTDGDLLMHDWNFTVSDTDSCSCTPYISGINPSQGLKGQCVTITGYCFKGSVPNDATNPKYAETTQLVFNSNVANIGGSDRRYITSSIPTGTGINKGDRLIPNVTITYNSTALGSVKSNNSSIEYYIDSEDESQGPCLYSLKPDQACTEKPVELYGIRFGEDPLAGNRSTATENITMNDGNLQVPDPQVTWWTETNANITVLPTTVDGGVAITVAGQQSNSIPFDLMCSVGASCDSDPSTLQCTDSGACGAGLFCDVANSCTCQPIVVVPPELPMVIREYPTCSASCLNALIGAEFNHDIDTTTLSNASIDVYPCGTDCSSANLGPEIAFTHTYEAVTKEVIIDPVSDLTAGAMYRVVLKDTIARPTGETLAGLNYDLDDDGTKDSYSWTFSTKDSVCSISGVEISPKKASADRINQEVGFTSYALGDNGICGSQRLSSIDYDWKWSSSVTSVATVSNDDNDNDINSYTDPKQRATVLTDGTTNITANSGGYFDTAELKVGFIACNSNSDCSKIDASTNAEQCPGSVCDLASSTCTPVINDLSPAEGPAGRWATVQGCYFGSSKGTNGEVLFGTTPAKYPSCSGGSWGNDTIIVEVPGMASGNTYPVTVKTDRGLTTTKSKDFKVTAQCGGNVIPPTEIPGICYLSPSQGAIQSPTTIVGDRFGSVVDTVSFTDGTGTVGAIVNPNDWENKRIQTTVPISADTGDVVVTVNSCPSNGVPYTVTTSVGSPCDSDTVAPSCQESDRMCGSGNTGLYCDPNTCSCAIAPLPQVVWSYPFSTSANACRNTIAQVVFDSLMDYSTVTSTVVFLADENNSRVIDVTLKKYNVNSLKDPRILSTFPDTIKQVADYNKDYGRTVVEIIPGSVLDANAKYTLNVTENAQSIYGKPLASAYSNTFNTKAEICQIDRVGITVNPPGLVKNDDFFTCAGLDSCPGDQDINQSGNQHGWIAQAYDASVPVNGLIADYTWTENGESNLYTLSNTSISNPLITAVPKNGVASFTVIAKDTGAGSASANIRAENFICDNPWPALDSPKGFPYVETTTDFATFYCRDKGGSKACLDSSGSVVGRSCKDSSNCGGGTCVSNVCQDDQGNDVTQCSTTEMCNGGSTSYICGGDPSDDLPDLGTPIEQSGPTLVEREVFFFPVNSSDVIAIQVYTNADFLNPAVWYATHVPNPGSPQSIVVDGYSAIRDGRTVYVSAAKNMGGNKYTAYIYLISYNEGASSDVVEIYNQLIENWRFTTNITDITNAEQIRRDTQRVTDLGAMRSLLRKYKQANGKVPLLSSGSFKVGNSTSVWPSWNDELGKALGTLLPKDPLNTFSECPATGTTNPERYEQSSCWNKTDRLFNCADGSRIYQYEVTDNGNNAKIYANLEFDKASWAFNSVTPSISSQKDTCRSFSIDIN